MSVTKTTFSGKKLRFAPFLLAVFVVFAACSAEKKGPIPRAYHSFISLFNGYYNATVRYKDGMKGQEKEIVLPEEGFLIPGLSGGPNGGSFGLFDEAITKCDHIIFRHKNGSYCDDAYLLKGKCSYQKGNYTEALISLEYILKKYPDSKIKPLVLLWLAKTNYAQGYNEQANQLVKQAASAGEVGKKMKPEMAQLQASVLIKDKKYNEAIGVLFENIKYVKSKKMKSVWYYLIAQLYDAVGDFKKSFENYQIAIKIDQYNEMTFRAKLAIAQLYVKYQPKDSDPNVVGKTLSSLLKEKKYEDYRDQIYLQYAMLELNANNHKKALNYLKQSLNYQGKGNTIKTRAYFEAGKIYFYKFERLDSAMAYFDSAAKIVPEKFADYDQVKTLSTTLKKYTEYKRTIKLTDSLLAFSNLSDKELKQKIEKIVEKEEKARIEKKEKARREAMQRQGQMQMITQGNPNIVDPTQYSSGFYFDDRQRIARGSTEFERAWGKRKLEDYWRRKNKQAVPRDGEEELGDYKSEEDSIAQVNARKEKYFKNIPRTDSAIAANNEKLRDAMFDLSQLYYQKLDMPDSAIFYYKKVIDRFANSDYAPKAWYAIYNLYNDQKNAAEAEKVKQLILQKYPESVYAKLVKKENVADVSNATNKEFNIAYKKLYDAYLAERYSEVISASAGVTTQYLSHPDVAQVYYLRGSSYGKMDQLDSLISIYKYLIKNFPDTEVAKVAKNTLNLLNKDKAPETNAKDEPKEEKDPAKEEPKKEEDIFAGFVPRKNNDPICAILLVEKSKISFNDINVAITDFNQKNFANEKLQMNNFTYKDKNGKDWHCLYVRVFNDFTLADNYLKIISADAKLMENVENKENQLFFMTTANFRFALSKKRFSDYAQYYQKFRNEIMEGTK